MGLDISAYYGAKKVDGDIEDDHHVNIYILDAFRKQADGLIEGCYELPVPWYFGEHFRAGGYSWYNAWRNWLAGVVGKTDKEIWENPDPSIPFVDLINFADNEGTIGPKTSGKLHEEFVRLWPDALKATKKIEDNYTAIQYMTVYLRFSDAFETARNKGFVVFH